ncbi:MAG: tRNA pseudouridine(38-40) synthase TruA [Pseudomonadota bacterium]
MPRYKLTIEYDGRPFCGWQRQSGQPSVQAALERAAEGLDERPVTVFGAGRTDTGVHAMGQVAHIDLMKQLPVAKVADALNAHLRPEPVAIIEAQEVSEAFHARFSAVERHYRYRIVNRRAPLTTEKGLAWQVPQALDRDAMATAANALIGRHDFTTFRDAQCQAESPIKTLDEVRLQTSGEEINVYFCARSFLHRQVRSMVGSLVEVGRGRHDGDWIADILASADRSLCGPVSPPDGLYLMNVIYPD